MSTSAIIMLSHKPFSCNGEMFGDSFRLALAYIAFRGVVL